MSVKGFAAVVSGEPLARHKKVKICALLQVAPGENVVALVPLVSSVAAVCRVVLDSGMIAPPKAFF